MTKNYGRVLSLFLIWRGAILLLGYLSWAVIPNNTYTVAHLPQSVHPLLDIWVKWDSVWFYEIIISGYVREGLTAFFPLYPLGVRVAAAVLFFVNPILVGLALSSLFFLISILVFYKLLRLDSDEPTSNRAIFYLLIFPSSLFFTLVYSESLFLLLSVSSFYLARKKRWWLCGLCGFLAALTRPVGILLFIPLLIEKINSQGRLSFLALFLIPLGLLSYLLYLKLAFGDPLTFLHVQKDWGRFSGDLISSLNLIKSGFFLSYVAASVIVYKWVRRSYGLYIFLSLLPPLISGSFMSINRHFAVLFPIYIILAQLGKNYLVDRAITIIFLLFLAYSTILYVNGYWVG